MMTNFFITEFAFIFGKNVTSEAEVDHISKAIIELREAEDYTYLDDYIMEEYADQICEKKIFIEEINIETMKEIFYLWLIFVGISAIIYIVQRLQNRRKSRVHPSNNDKYKYPKIPRQPMNTEEELCDEVSMQQSTVSTLQLPTTSRMAIKRELRRSLSRNNTISKETSRITEIIPSLIVNPKLLTQKSITIYKVIHRIQKALLYLHMLKCMKK